MSPDASQVEASGGDGGVDSSEPVVDRGTRTLGVTLDITDLDFPKNLDVAKDAGAQTTAVTFGWDEIEIPYDAGVTDPDAAAPPNTTLFNAGLHISNLILSDRSVEATLSIEIFDVGGSRMPSDLAGRALDDATVLARYDALLDYVFDQMHDTSFTALVVASGADAWLTADPSRASHLAAFVTHAAAHAHAIKPKLKVGFTVDDVGGAEKNASALKPAWAASDFAGLDDVPSDAVVASGPQLDLFTASQLVRILNVVPSPTPILFRQAGYPSAGPGTSQAAQATFVAETFRAWDEHPDRVFAIVFRELDDATTDQAKALAARRGRPNDAAYVAFLTSLGMRDPSRKEKAALGELRRGAHARGW